MSQEDKIKRILELENGGEKYSDESWNDSSSVPQYIPYTNEMRQYIILPEDGYQAYLEREYIKIREKGFDDISTIAKNTGISEMELYKMKKHVFLDTHMISVNGKPLEKFYFQADSEIAYAWKQAMKRKLSLDEKEWFEQLVKHELAESSYMKQGMPLRDPSTFINGMFQVDPLKNAHDKANITAPQPGDYPGHDWSEEFMKYVNDKIEY